MKSGDIVQTPASKGILRDDQGKPALIINIEDGIIEVDAGKSLLYKSERLTPIGKITFGKEYSIRNNRFRVCNIRIGDKEKRVDVKIRDASGWQIACSLDIKRLAWKQYQETAL